MFTGFTYDLTNNRSGLRVLATCSPSNFKLVKSRGADMVFDYNSPSAIQDIKTATDDQLGLIFDYISEKNSPSFCFEAIGKSGRKYSSLLPPATECPRKDIAVSMVFAYTSFGEAFAKFGFKFPAKLEDYMYTSKFFDICEALLAEGKLKPHLSAHQPNRFNGILDGLHRLREGQVSRKKLVYLV
jgi:NADPH:quinone reductase-like Zn-dependent oxidoreductase